MLLVSFVLLFCQQPAQDFEDGLVLARQNFLESLASTGLASRASSLSVIVDGDGPPQSYRFEAKDGRLYVRASDKLGALWAVEELAERVVQEGEKLWRSPVVERQPFMQHRGYALWLQADPDWLAEDSFWNSLRDQMLRGRYSQLEWVLDGRNDPSGWSAWMVPMGDSSMRALQAGQRIQHLRRRLQQFRAAGLEVGLRLVPPLGESPFLIQGWLQDLPGLSFLGIDGWPDPKEAAGQETMAALLQSCQRQGVAYCLHPSDLETSRVRAWAGSSVDFRLQIDFADGSLGLPFPSASSSFWWGRWMATAAEATPARLWPGRPSSTQAWPSQPYRLFWRVPVGGSPRRLPAVHPNWIRQAIQSMAVGTCSGLVLNPGPPRWTQAGADGESPWFHRRDPASFALWGRLAFQPDFEFEPVLDRTLGQAVAPWSSALQAGSQVAQVAASVFGLFPGFRGEFTALPEPESWLASPPRENFVFRSPMMEMAVQATGGHDGRQGMVDLARFFGQALQRSKKLPLAKWRQDSAIRDQRMWTYAAASRLLTLWGSYLQAACRSASSLTSLQAFPELASSHGPHAWAAAERSLERWETLCSGRLVSEFPSLGESLDEAGGEAGGWKAGLPQVKAALAEVRERLGPTAKAQGRILGGRAAVPPRGQLQWQADGADLMVRYAGPEVDAAWLLEKALPATFWTKTAMEPVQGDFRIRFPRKEEGHLLAVEVRHQGVIKRFPVWTDAQPFVIVPALDRPAPIQPSLAGALGKLAAAEAGNFEAPLPRWLLVGPQAREFWRAAPETHAAVFAWVEAGAQLLILDPTPAGGGEVWAWPASQSGGLKSYAATKELPFLPEVPSFPESSKLIAEGSDSPWQILGDGAVARRRIGKGTVFWVRLPFERHLHRPGLAAHLLAWLQRSQESPWLILDPGLVSDGRPNPLLPDFLNAHHIPFQSLPAWWVEQLRSSTSRN
ncbi:MAG: hypothetical protein DWQ01_17675 [Planctomycetota bacterium]|nr:MAG: hypothetical protein DWQ01_17675 [Planctomycetota bacterium]